MQSALTWALQPTNRSDPKRLPEIRDFTEVAKVELGTKRQCQNCGAKFFDLNKDPIVCPKCGTIFQGMTARAQRAAHKDEEEEEEAVAPAGIELVPLEEADAGEDKVAAVADDDIEVEDDEAVEDTFLEEEEEDDDDVAALIDGDIVNDEEP
jgi:uncharacterized protein (TIGR02300 family)